MSELVQAGGRRWIKAGWSALIIGWLGYFALMAFSTRSPWMHTYAAYLAVGFGLAVLLFVFLGWRNREGGHWRLLMALIISPAVWYFFAVFAMAVIVYSAG